MKNLTYILIELIVFIQIQALAQSKNVFQSKKNNANKAVVLSKTHAYTNSIKENVLAKPTATTVIPAFTPTAQIICIGEVITFTNTSIDALTYSWNFGDGGTSIADNPSYTYTASGQYTVSLTAINGTVQATVSDVITVNNPPNADFTIQQIDNCNGTVQFNCLGNVTNNSWQFSDGTIINDTCQVVKTIAPQGTHSATLILNPNASCSATITKAFPVTSLNEDLGTLPNVISPNFDGVNDYIDFSKYIKCGNFEYEIFDRWGLSIISSSNSKQGIWDGRTLSGKAVTEGTYFYTIKTANQSYKGTINVFR